MYLLLCVFAFFSPVFAQDSSEIDSLKKRVDVLTEISNEQSGIIKRQLKDLHYDQNSRGYLEVKFGLSQLNPDDIEDENDEMFNGMSDADWEDFGNAKIIELEIGKSILLNDGNKVDVGVGYQFLTSEIEGSFSDTGGEVIIREKIKIHTLFARGAYLIKGGHSEKFFFGPGLTLGYSPVSELQIELEQGIEGAQVKGEGDSMLLEVFCKGKYELSRYFNIVFVAGYRMQEAEDLRLNAAELVSVKTKTDLDASGVYGTVGVGVNF